MNLKRCSALIGCLASALLLLSNNPAHGQKPAFKEKSRLDRDFVAATGMIEVGDFERALPFLDYMQQTYGPNPEIRTLYKRIYVEMKMYPELEALVLQELADSPDDPLVLAELASVRFLLDDLEAADSLWNLALEKGQNLQSAYLAVGGYKLRFGDYDGAISVYELGRRKLGNPRLFSSNLASIYESRREYDRAVQEYLLQLEQNPGRLGTVSSRVRGLLEDSDNPEKIVTAVKNALGKSDDPEVIRILLGDIYIRLGRFDQALDTYKTIGSRKKDDGASLFEFARRCFDYRAYQAAVKAVDEYFATSKSRSLRDRALLLRGRAERSLDSLNQAIDTLLPLFGQSTDAEVRDMAGYEVGSIYAVEKEDCDRAVSIWNDLIRTARSEDIINATRVDLASCLIKLENLERAESLLTAVSSGEKPGPVSERALFLRGEIAFFKGEYPRAASIYRQLIRNSPGCDFANNALERLMIIEAENTGDGYTVDLDRFAQGARAQAMGRLQEAAGIFSDRAFRSSAIGEQALFAAALVYREAGNDDLAMKTLNGYIDQYPLGYYVDRAFLNLGDMYMLKKETRSLARDAFNKILEKFPDGPVSGQARARLKKIETLDEIG